MKDIAHVEWHHDRDGRENENRHRRDHADHRETRLVRAHIAKPILDSAGTFFLLFLAPDRPRRERNERDDEGEEGKGVGKKGHRGTPNADNHTRDRRTDQSRAMKNRAIQRHCAGDFLPPHELRDESGKGRMLKSKSDA